MRCKAKSKQSGERCKRNAASGKEVCATHGGKSPGAPIKHARYCKDLPKQLQPFYEAAERDKDLLSLRSEAALLQAFISDGLAALDINQCQAAWDTLEALCKMLRETRDTAEEARIAHKMASVVSDGVEPWRQIGRVLGYVDQKRTLADTESKRIKAQAETMTAKEAFALVSYMADAIRSEFGDQPQRVARVTTKLALVLGGKADEPADRAA